MYDSIFSISDDNDDDELFKATTEEVSHMHDWILNHECISLSSFPLHRKKRSSFHSDELYIFLKLLLSPTYHLSSSKNM